MQYILENKKPVLCNLQEWAQWFSFNKGLQRIVAQEKVLDTNIIVSTCFLLEEHNPSSTGKPVLFETRVFGGAFNELTQRYCTWQEAEEGHKEVVSKVEKAIQEFKDVKLDEIYAKAKKKYRQTLKKLSK